MRYCINSASLRFIHFDDLEAEGYGEFIALFEIKEASERRPDRDPGGRLLLGHAGSDPQAAGRGVDPRRLHRRRERHATYRNHPGHAEAIEIATTPQRPTSATSLEFFFQIHDPSTKNRQGNDIGTSYRSAIFYVDDEQKRVAMDTIADVDASGCGRARWSPR